MKNIQQEVINGNLNPYDLIDLWVENPLNKEDIESLGWKHFYDDFTFGNYTKIKNLKEKYSLDYDYQIHTCEINIINSEGVEIIRTLFNGKIKNKLELKKLMQMLDIQ
jgi:hypothetical protein